MVNKVNKGKLLPIQLGLVVLMVVVLVAAKFNVLSPIMGFRVTMLAVIALLIVMIVSMIRMLWLFLKHPEQSNRSAKLALLIGLLPLAIILVSLKNNSVSGPLIHDVSTDLLDPPSYFKAYNLRAKSENSLDHEGESVAQLQRKAYPDIQTLQSPMNVSQAVAASIKSIEQLGWEVLWVDEAQGYIEAVDETFIFSFKDDVVVRIRATQDGSMIDVRSVSRVGKGDMGANAKRIKNFLDLLKSES